MIGIELNRKLIEMIDLVKYFVKDVIKGLKMNIDYNDDNLNNIVVEVMNYYPNVDWLLMNMSYDENSEDKKTSNCVKVINHFVLKISYEFFKLDKDKGKEK